jgi:hypothetical protein
MVGIGIRSLSDVNYVAYLLPANDLLFTVTRQTEQDCSTGTGGRQGLPVEPASGQDSSPRHQAKKTAPDDRVPLEQDT